MAIVQAMITLYNTVTFCNRSIGRDIIDLTTNSLP
ncbi:hypothetical protein Osc7112_6891 (plasmid) [Oscillatoria nigro-viridis PCC 7112]|uniref:Uncharacterized protein n=1 Tax=Phormidium nigroviride PCC 7112 TaxID=179408 RepID=K9VSQ5_9CYAN|nr:hypothetical protein Osc7112_6891 [Oscillatoria nigro-viridis PCC 7112]